MNKSLGVIGLCRKAGKLIFGFDAVVFEMKRKNSKVKGVFLAKDISENSQKEIRFFAEKYNVNVIATEFTMNDIESVLKKRTGILAVTDSGFFKLISDNLN